MAKIKLLVKIDRSSSIRNLVSRQFCRNLSQQISRGSLTILRAKQEGRFSVGVQIVNDRDIAELNRRFMHKSGPTDVLSFPTANGSVYFDHSMVRQHYIGDIVLSWPAILRQACKRNHWNTQERELYEATTLAIHGMAHLLGHDHRFSKEGRKMHRLERSVLNHLRIPDIARPYGLRPVRSN